MFFSVLSYFKNIFILLNYPDSLLSGLFSVVPSPDNKGSTVNRMFRESVSR